MRDWVGGVGWAVREGARLDILTGIVIILLFVRHFLHIAVIV